jgi:phosphoglycerol transferase
LQASCLVGFSWAEPWGRWTDARILPDALVHLSRPLPGSFALELVAMGASDPASAFDVRVGDVVHTLSAPAGRLATLEADFTGCEGREVVVLHPHDPISAGTAMACGDPRRLGIGVQSIRVRPQERPEDAARRESPRSEPI